MLIGGSTPWEIDEAMLGFGCEAGAFETQDDVGVDACLALRRRLSAALGRPSPRLPIAGRLLEEGRVGRSGSVGWYRYPGGEGLVIDPLVEDLVCEEARFAGVARRAFDAAEIRERLILAMIDEACRLLDEGALARASDVDLVSVLGLGFPRRRGGLMHHADRVGAAALVARVRALAPEDPLRRETAPRLLRAAADGRSPSAAAAR